MRVALLALLLCACAAQPNTPPVLVPLSTDAPLGPPETLGHGACLFDTDRGSGITGASLARALSQAHACRQAEATRIANQVQEGGIGLTRGAAAMINLRGNARRDLQAVRQALNTLSPQDRQTLADVADTVERESQGFALGAT